MVKKAYDQKTKSGWIADQLNHDVGYLECPTTGSFHLYITKNGVGVWLTRKQLVQLKGLIDTYCKEEGI